MKAFWPNRETNESTMWILTFSEKLMSRMFLIFGVELQYQYQILTIDTTIFSCGGSLVLRCWPRESRKTFRKTNCWNKFFLVLGIKLSSKWSFAIELNIFFRLFKKSVLKFFNQTCSQMGLQCLFSVFVRNWRVEFFRFLTWSYNSIHKGLQLM